MCALSIVAILAACASTPDVANRGPTPSTGPSGSSSYLSHPFSFSGYAHLVERASNPACVLLQPSEIKGTFGSALTGPYGGRTESETGDICIYQKISSGLMLVIYFLPAMSASTFHSQNFLIPPVGPIPSWLSQSFPVGGIGDEAIYWDVRPYSEAVVAFRKKSKVAIVAVTISSHSTDKRSPISSALSLAKDAASAMPS
jgi:hypothetical protein